MGKSGGVFGPGQRGGTMKEGAEAGETVQPALAAGGAPGGKMVRKVVGMRVRRAGGGAEEVEVDAVHGLRPI